MGLLMSEASDVPQGLPLRDDRGRSVEAAHPAPMTFAFRVDLTDVRAEAVLHCGGAKDPIRSLTAEPEG